MAVRRNDGQRRRYGHMPPRFISMNSATIYQFPSRRGRCAQKYCGRPMILKNPSNVPAYCDYSCAVAAQPEHTKDGMFTHTQGGAA